MRDFRRDLTRSNLLEHKYYTCFCTYDRLHLGNCTKQRTGQPIINSRLYCIRKSSESVVVAFGIMVAHIRFFIKVKSLFSNLAASVPAKLVICARMSSSNTKSLISTKHVGFLGSGQMAQAMAKGFLSNGTLQGSQVTMSDRFGPDTPDAHLFEPIKEIKDKYGIEYLQDNRKMAQRSDLVFACVKPNVILTALDGIAQDLDNKLVISVAAGITMEQMRQVLPKTTRLVRIMPNTPCLVQAGTAVFSRGATATDEDIAMTSSLCSSIFTVFEEIPESLINAASGISGCGPAYMFLIAEALADGGVRMGVPRPLAHKLAVSTMAGAAAMMEKTGENPSKLKNDVCSPGGSTIAAVHALEDGGVRAAIMNAVRAAAIRGEELSK